MTVPPHPEPVTPDQASDIGRTGLAWSRSGLANVAVGVVIAKGLPLTAGIPAQPVVGVVVVLLGLAGMVVGAAAARHRNAAPPGTRATDRDTVPLAICSAVTGLAVLVLVAIAA